MNNIWTEDPIGRQLLDDAQYRNLFQKIREGFFVGEVVRDGGGRVVDFVFLETNEAIGRYTVVSPEEMLGRRVSEVAPSFPRSVVERYGAVVDTGEPAALEIEVEQRSFEARAHPLGGERFAVLFLEITERKRIERALQESRALLNVIIDSVDPMIWTARPDGYVDYYNSRWYAYTGAPHGSTDGDAWARLFHPDDRERTFARWHHSLATGEPYEIEYRLRHHSGPYRWVLGRAHPVRGDSGQIIRWMGTCTDIHTQKEFAERSELASLEMNHRVKNVFAAVLGLVTLSLRDHSESRPFADELRDRITTLSEAHDYARPQKQSSKLGPGEATVLGLVRRLLRPYALKGHDRVVIDGDDGPLAYRAATPVSLAVHELATNAVKYGAFSVPEGHVYVRGERSAARFTLYWRERGGPRVREPVRLGFGSRLVNTSLRDQLHGELTRDWRPEGLEVRVSAPADEIVARASA